jgi:N-acyl amino acid synthase of PEP-CTERM/exosortase system
MGAETTHRKRVVTGCTLSVAQAISAPPEESLLTRLNRYFETAVADTPELIRQAHELRYRVYCLEMTGFENPHDHPDGLEKDAYDVSSVHGLLIHRVSRQATGTVRLVLPRIEAPEHSFAIQSVTDHPALSDPSEFPHTTAEVSRFCISRQFRRRASDTLYDQKENDSTGEGRSGPLMRLGLIQVLLQMSAQHGITHWCAVMEPTLLRMLAGMAIRFKPIGPPVEYHGLRQPCICSIAEILHAVKCERPAFWEALTCGGILTF